MNWCWEGTTVTPLVVLTTAHKGPVCSDHTAWFPPTPLNRSGASVRWEAGELDDAWFPIFKNTPAVRVDGEPARSATGRPSNSAKWRDTGCGGRTGGDLALVTQIRPPHGDNYFMTACLRGPHFATNGHAVQQMLDSVRFADYVR